MTSTPQPTVTVTRQRCDERRASLDRLIRKYGYPTPTQPAPEARDEQVTAKRPA